MTTPTVLPKNPRKILSARRVALLASAVAGFGALALLGPTVTPPNSLTTPAYAQSIARPAGFADIVEKVKPSVISVRVKVGESGPQVSSFNGEQFNFPPGSPMEQFFKRFGGSPDGQNAEHAAPPQLRDRPGLGLLHLG